MTKYGVNFDIGFYIEVEANSPEEAIDYAKDHLHEAIEGEAHGFESQPLKQKDSSEK